MATHSGILAWRIPRTEDPSGLQSLGLQRVRHDRPTNTHIQYGAEAETKPRCGSQRSWNSTPRDHGM